jgi:hypothetical protein
MIGEKMSPVMAPLEKMTERLEATSPTREVTDEGVTLPAEVRMAKLV